MNMNYLAASSSGSGPGRHGSTRGPSPDTDMNEQVRRDMEQITITGDPVQENQEIDELTNQLKGLLGAKYHLTEEQARQLAEKARAMSLQEQKEPETHSQSTQPVSSSDQESNNTGVEFSTRSTPFRSAYSSDSQSSRVGSYNSDEGSPNNGNNASAKKAANDALHEAALLNLQHRGHGQESEGGAAKRDTGLKGIGTSTCALTPGRNKRTPSKQGERKSKRQIPLRLGLGGNNGYISQTNTSSLSPDNEHPSSQQHQPGSVFNRIICSKPMRDEESEKMHVPNAIPSTSPSSSASSFNPSFPAPSPIGANTGRSTTPVARRPQSSPTARPGLQEKEENEESSRHPSPVGERGNSKPSPRPKCHQSGGAGDDDGTQQPTAPRAFASPNSPAQVAFTPAVRTVNSQESSYSAFTNATPSQDDVKVAFPSVTPKSAAGGTPMDFSPFVPSYTPVAQSAPFDTGTSPFPDDDPFGDTPRPIKRTGPTPYPDRSVQVPQVQVHPPVAAPAPVQEAPMPQPVQFQQDAIPQQQMGYTGGFNLGSKKTKKKTRIAGVTRSSAVRFPPSADGEVVGASAVDEKQNAQVAPPPEAQRVPSPMAVDQNTDLNVPDTGFQMGKKKPLGKINGGRFRLPGDNVTAPSSAANAVQQPPHVPVDHPPAPVPAPEPDYSGIVELVKSKREEGRNMYMNADYRGSIVTFTAAIQKFATLSGTALFDGDTMALLLANRAAALLMLGALDAAIDDCRHGLEFVSDGGPHGERFSNESGPPLKLKLQNRLGRALLRKGLDAEAYIAFEQAIKTAQDAVELSRRVHPPAVAESYASSLGHQEREASLGLNDVIKLQGILEPVRLFLKNSVNNHRGYSEPLNHLNLAMQISTGSEDLIQIKVQLLCRMKRWREIAGVLERYAALNVKLDGVFTGDLAPKNPFPSVEPAKHLREDAFFEAREEDSRTAGIKLSSRASAEAVLRLPYQLTELYLRTLRLQERYPAAEAAIAALEDLVHKGTTQRAPEEMRVTFRGLPKERSKLERTKSVREKGDEYYRTAQYEKAAREYAHCLTIDGENQQLPQEGPNAGGRLHAVLHCNRAAANMAAKKHEEALKDCSDAIRIHSRYMKAILRRARCYSRLIRYQEAISEFEHWLGLAGEAKKNKGPSPIAICMFDGPGDVKESDIETVRKELETNRQYKRRADALLRDQNSRREQERRRWNDAFSSAHTAQQRREHFYNREGPRHWDPFDNRGPRPEYRRSASAGPNAGYHQSQSHGRSHSEGRNNRPVSDTMTHYAVLQIGRNATDRDIKKAYRTLCLTYHPDKNKDKDAQEKFHVIKNAYDVLIDHTTRSAYDRTLPRV